MDDIVPGQFTIAIVSDLHYAGAAERARGNDYEGCSIANPLLRAFIRFYRHFIWMRNPLDQAPQLDRFLKELGPVDYVIANGDYSCDSGFVGVSDPASFDSAQECISKLLAKFGDRMRFTLGDHELGKLTLFGGKGGMRMVSWKNATESLGLQPFWKLTLGNYVLMGVASPLIALPANRPDTLPEEWPAWQKMREDHLAEIRTAFDALKPTQRVLLFCHDPTALPFLWLDESVRSRLPQIEHTIIGHLHTRLIMFQIKVANLLGKRGFPRIKFLGNSVRKFSFALHESYYWRPFNVLLCPALSGIQLLNDGGYYTAEIDPSAVKPLKFIFHPLKRKNNCNS